MKPIGGIVTNKKSIPDNFRQVETFTTEYLSKLWKIYTINRDVLDKGRRLENLFWRIWGSERIDRTFSGQTVSTIFMMILEGEARFEQTKYRIPPRPIHVALPPPSIETLITPRPSLEIHYPPTPPPSPIPPVTSIVGFKPNSSYLSKLPSQTDITAYLQRAFPDVPPSPPIPDARPGTNPTIPEGVKIPDISSSQLPISSISNTTITIVAHVQVATVVSEEDSSTSSKETRKPTKARKAKSEPRPERPPRGRRKIVAKASNTKATTARVAVKKMRPVMQKRKSNSSSNTAVNTAVSSPSNTLTVDAAQSLPSSNQKQQQRNSSTSGGSESEDTRRKGDLSGSGWVVDPDFRTKYLERKQKEKLVALASIIPIGMTKTNPTTVVSEDVATTSTKIPRGKGKNVLVDGIVPLKGLTEDVEDTQVTEVMAGSKRDKEIDELPSNLVRGKSELTLLIEGARKAGEKSGKERSTEEVQEIKEEKVQR